MHRFRQHGAFSLVEVLIASAAGALLMVGLATTLSVSRQTLELAQPVEDRVALATAIDRLSRELSSAVYILQADADKLTFISNDLTGDGLRDVITYSWDGDTDGKFTRQVNNSVPLTITTNINQVSFTYLHNVRQTPLTIHERYTPTTNFASAFLDSDSLDVDELTWIAVRIDPPSLPDNAVRWSLHAVALAISVPVAGVDGFKLRITSATEENIPVCDSLYAANDLGAATDIGGGWYRFDFTPLFFSPNEHCCLLLQGTGPTTGATVQQHSVASAVTAKTTDGGATWSTGANLPKFSATQRYRLPATHNVTRTFVENLTIVAQLSNQTAVVERSIDLHNQPVLATQVRELHFVRNPTTLDRDYDGSADWVLNHGTIKDSDFAMGVLSANQFEIESAVTGPINASATLNWRAQLGAATSAVECRFGVIHPPTNLPANFGLRLTSNGSLQRLGLYEFDDANVETLVMELNDLPTGFVDVLSAIEPNNSFIHLVVNGVDVGGVTYASTATAAQPLQIGAGGGPVSIDYFRLMEH